MDYNSLHLFHFYVRSDYFIEQIRKLLAEGISPNQQIKLGNTPLHTAAASTTDNIRVIQELIKAGADVNLINSKGLTPLHFAVILRKRDMIKTLLKSGADINARSPSGTTALHYAINNRGYEFLRGTRLHEQLLPFKCIPDLFIISMLLQDKNIDVNAIGINGETPLMWAVADRQIMAVKVLLKSGANPNICNAYGQSSLHIALAASRPCIRIANLLLRHEANMSNLDSKNRTPIDVLIDGIEDEKSLKLAEQFIKMVVLQKNISKKFENNLESYVVLKFLQKTCSAEVEQMKTEVISQNLTVHDFLLDCFNEDQFENPLLDIYKPLVDILMNARYLTYAYDILHGIGKWNLLKVLEYYLYLQNKVENFRDKEREELLKKYTNRVLSKSLSYWDLFELILSHSKFIDIEIGK